MLSANPGEKYTALWIRNLAYELTCKIIDNINEYSLNHGVQIYSDIKFHYCNYYNDTTPQEALIPVYMALPGHLKSSGELVLSVSLSSNLLLSLFSSSNNLVKIGTQALQTIPD